MTFVPQSDTTTSALFAYRHEPDAYFSGETIYHVPCSQQASILPQGDVQIAYCDGCKAIDAQSFEALAAVFTWLKEHESEPLGGDPELNEFHGEDKHEFPAVEYPYVRLWRFTYEVTVEKPVPPEEATEPDEVELDDEERCIIVALKPDGAYFVEQDEYLLCAVVLTGHCHRYLHKNERGVYACPEHGEALDVIEPEEEDLV
jgi:hypothetical protein